MTGVTPGPWADGPPVTALGGAGLRVLFLHLSFGVLPACPSASVLPCMGPDKPFISSPIIKLYNQEPLTRFKIKMLQVI